MSLPDSVVEAQRIFDEQCRWCGCSLALAPIASSADAAAQVIGYCSAVHQAARNEAARAANGGSK